MSALDIANHISRQAKLYDKIIKENMHKVLPGVIKDVLGIEIVSSEDLPESLQHTKETVPDQLCKVIDSKGQTYILHVEWQSENDASMDNRMLEYRVMLRRKYQLSVKQYVIFLARPKSTMPYLIDEENLRFRYELVILQQYSHKIFLNSGVPEQKLLAIFGTFGQEEPVTVIRQILKGVQHEAEGELSGNRYIEQLRGLIQLRKLGKEFKIAMGTITKFKVEKDPFYQEGIEKGIEKGMMKRQREIARNLKNMGVAIADIAKGTGLSVEEIKEL